MTEITVLFVDDEKSMLNSLQLNLVREPYGKLFAENAEAGLEIMAKEPVHVVISDMRMPGMDGLAFLAQVRQLYPETVRLIFSAFTDVPKIIASINTGEIFRYITKPIQDTDEFTRTIREAIKHYLVHRERDELVERLQVMNRELLDANTRLSEMDRVKSEFVSIVSHELRTPLTSIIGFAQTMKTLDLSDAQKLNYLDIIDQEGQRLDRLITDYLSVSRIQMGRMEMRIGPVDVGALLAEISESFSMRTIPLTIAVSGSVHSVPADRDRLKEVLLNLVDNAFRYAQTKVTIEVKAGDGVLIIVVADDGPGIPKESQACLFESFRRLDDEITLCSKGSGLGLTISKGIVEGHRGRIFIDSEPGAGTRFIVELPVKQDATDVAGLLTIKEPASEGDHNG